MRILAWTLSYWHDSEMAKAKSDGVLGLRAWGERMRYLFQPIDLFIACGSWSDPTFNPLPTAHVINAGFPFDRPYVGQRWHYGKAAYSAALAYALNRNDWDLLVVMDHDALFGDIDLDSIVREFWNRQELILAPGWHGFPGGPMQIVKRAGALRLCHFRQTANMRDDDEELQMIWEQECYHIFRNGLWWNPWPQYEHLFQEFSEGFHDIVMSWPMVNHMRVATAEAYAVTQSIKTKPFMGIT